MKKNIAFFFTTVVLISVLIGCSSGVSQQDYEALQQQVDSLLQENQQLKEAAESESTIPQELISNPNSTTLPITFDFYHNIKVGMQYEEVVRLIGDYGIKVTVVGENTDKVLTTMKWNAYDAQEDYTDTETSFVFCQFENNSLIKKWADLEFIYWDFSKISFDQFKAAYPNASDDEFTNFINGLVAYRNLISANAQCRICRIPSSKLYRHNIFSAIDPARDEAEIPSSEAWNSIMETILDTVK